MRYKIYKNKAELITQWSNKEKSALDLGYYGQVTGRRFYEEVSPHELIRTHNKETYGVDLEGEEDAYHFRMNAEDFRIPHKFSSIFALDLIEHVSNAGNFLDSVHAHLEDDGVFIVTTPNCFSLFHFAGKLTNYEPVVNKQHTCYYNLRTLKTLATRHNFTIHEVSYIRDLGCIHKESLKKKLLNVIDYTLSLFTTKYMETIAVVLKKK